MDKKVILSGIIVVVLVSLFYASYAPNSSFPTGLTVGGQSRYAQLKACVDGGQDLNACRLSVGSITPEEFARTAGGGGEGAGGGAQVLQGLTVSTAPWGSGVAVPLDTLKVQEPAFTTDYFREHYNLCKSGVHPFPPFTEQELLTRVADYTSLSDDDLRSKINTQGSQDPKNYDLKEVAYAFACLYDLTKNEQYAHKAKVLLIRFSEVMSQWGMVTRWYVDEGQVWHNGEYAPRQQIEAAKNRPQGVQENRYVDWTWWVNGGLWGKKWYRDHYEGFSLLFAYHLLSSQNKLTPGERQPVRDALQEMAEFSLRQLGGEPLDNFGGPFYIGLIPYGPILDAPSILEKAMTLVRQNIFVGYYREGIWHEGSPGYHKQIAQNILGSDPIFFPAKIKTFFNFQKGLERRAETILHSLDYLTLPPHEWGDSVLLALHDGVFFQTGILGDKNWGFHKQHSEPYLYGGFGMGVLGRGEAQRQTQVYLDFTGTEGHEHRDNLNLVFFAKGGELLSETNYREPDGTEEDRPWHSSTPAHNTVVIDETNQLERWGSRFELTEDDKIDGFDHFIYEQETRQGNTKHFGNLQLWEFTPKENRVPSIQLVEAEGKNAYQAGVVRDLTPLNSGKGDVGKRADLYQRSLALVETGDDDTYLIDIFRVEGGQKHDWMLHGRLQEDYNFETEGLALRDVDETRFTIYPDGINKELEHLEIKKKAATDSAWSNTFISQSGSRVKTTMLPAPNTEVSYGRARSTRRQDEDAWFLDVRRTGGNSLFVAVHEPFDTSPKIRGVTKLAGGDTADSFVAFKVELVDGSVDYIAHNLGKEQYAVETIQDGSLTIKFSGRFMHVRMRNNELVRQFVVEGKGVCVNNNGLSVDDLSYRGKVVDIKRLEKGDPVDALMIDSVLPTDGMLDGQTILLTLGDGRTQGYTIKRVGRSGAYSVVELNEEPGLEIRDSRVAPGRKIAKFVFYPWHGVLGDVGFLISGNLYQKENNPIIATKAVTTDTAGICA